MYGAMQNCSVCAQNRYIDVNYMIKKDMSQMKLI